MTVSGPPDLVAFAYGADRADSVRIPGGPSAVTFQACPRGKRRFSGPGRLRFTEFAGGIAVAGPRCLPIDIEAYTRDLAGQPPSAFEPSGAAEAMVLVEPGHTATLVVPQLTPRDLALDYSRRSAAVRFESCPGADRTHFPGGIVAEGAGCAPLDVHPDGGDPVRVRLPLAARCG